MTCGAAGEARVQRDPAGVAAHHLDDEHAVVRVGGGVEAVDRLGGDLDRGVEAEGEVGAAEVVVDGLRDADDLDAEVGELGGDAEGVLAADGDQRVDAVGLEVGLDLLDPAVDLERVGARRAQDRAAAGQDAANLVEPELARVVLERALPAVAEPDELVAVLADALADGSADHRIETGAVAATGQHSDAHAQDSSNSSSDMDTALDRTAIASTKENPSHSTQRVGSPGGLDVRHGVAHSVASAASVDLGVSLVGAFFGLGLRLGLGLGRCGGFLGLLLGSRPWPWSRRRRRTPGRTAP